MLHILAKKIKRIALSILSFFIWKRASRNIQNENKPGRVFGARKPSIVRG
jgi:hypothetical protein